MDIKKIEKYLSEGSANYRFIFKDGNGENIDVVEIKASSSADAFDKAKVIARKMKGAKKVDMVVKKKSIGVYNLSDKKLKESEDGVMTYNTAHPRYRHGKNITCPFCNKTIDLRKLDRK